MVALEDLDRSRRRRQHQNPRRHRYRDLHGPDTTVRLLMQLRALIKNAYINKWRRACGDICREHTNMGRARLYIYITMTHAFSAE